MEARDKNLNLLASIGLALGAIFGLVGAFVGQAPLRGLFWGIDGTALVMAASLLTVKYFRKDCLFVAAGFLVFAIGQGLILSCAAASLDSSRPFFAAGAALWGVGLLLTGIPEEFALWVRALGFVSAALFLITAVSIFHGLPLTPTSSPLPFFAYPFLVLTFAGWIWTLLRETGVRSPAA